MPYLYHVISSATSLLRLIGVVKSPKIFGLFGKYLNFRCCSNSVNLIKKLVKNDQENIYTPPPSPLVVTCVCSSMTVYSLSVK